MDSQQSQPTSDSVEANKSPLTHAITSGVQTYLKDKGFKPIETEVPVEPGWVADVASVIVPTNTELQNMKLVPRKPAWPSYVRTNEENWWNNEVNTKIRQKHEEKMKEWKAKVDAIPAPLTALVEVKTTRSDWYGDPKWNKSSPTNLRYLAIPAGLLKRPEFPQGWFVLEFNVEGRLLRVAQEGIVSSIDAEKRMWTIHEIALKRHHRTEAVWMRSVMKRFNARQTEYKQDYRVGNVIRALVDVLHGGQKHYRKPTTVEECFQCHRMDFKKLSWANQAEVKDLWGKFLPPASPPAVSGSGGEADRDGTKDINL